MNKYKSMIMSILGIIVIGCTPFFISHDFDIQTADHKNVAILPFEMKYSGIISGDFLDNAFVNISEAESKAFMISYYNEVLNSTKGGKNPIRVNLQHHKNTLQILEENDIKISDTWDMKADKIAKLLEVDAVIRATIEKDQLITDLSSYGVDVGYKILEALKKSKIGKWLPLDIAKPKPVIANYSLVNGANGATLWSANYDKKVDWGDSANEIIDDINHTASKKFPYRI